jgi:hypothetical protein
LEEVFSSEELETVARKTGFCKRKSKVDPSVFFDLLMYDIGSGKPGSLSQLAIEALSEHDIVVSKQGIDKKFSDETLAFLKCLIEKQLSVKLDEQIEAGWLGSFNRVIIKDGTRFDLPEEYKDYLPGSGGSASKAGACIQFEYDLKSGQINYLDITESSRPDVKDAVEVLDTVTDSDLVIRDLGYYAFDSFVNISYKGAFYISRLRPKACVYEMKSGILERLDFKKVYAEMKKKKLCRMDKWVFIGSTEKMPVRLSIEIMPETVYEQRIRKTVKIQQKKGYQTSEEYKFMSRFNLFITNVPEELLPIEIISSLYRIRWQIELVFKIWKSIIGIHHTTKMKYKRWLCLLYIKLLIMVINWNIIMTQRNYAYTWKGKLLSLNKCFKTLIDNNNRLRAAIKQGERGVRRYMRWVDKIFNENHWLEKKNKTKGLEDLIYIMFCKSHKYAYI